MKTATTIIQETWKESWETFYNEALGETQNNEEMSSEQITNRIEMLNHANQHIDTILNQFNELNTIFPFISEATDKLERFLKKEDRYDYQPAGFEMEITGHIKLSCDSLFDITSPMWIDCDVEFDNDYLSITLHEQDEELKVYLKS
ncbi:hypothetical protein C3744_20850 [Priestia megaterium]|uniref:Uncharacterized protein n=1 Tax=Priestia megaterium TaxID=1404 RepID=A0A3D8WXU8_PRIMG|nr:hypothetical protein [Priestia megaterium]MDH3173641.1 hypothetical protein [Priestia megaterium]RDZ11513.1 hypothetical protein C3744_20850 [Priestia megaterium]